MNENLHDIDKLFKDGIDGHLEDLPPGVWDGVSHDLDKKQAVHYRDKYYRLKRVAIFFLLFAVTGGAGVLYYSISKKQEGKLQTESTHSSTSHNTTTAKQPNAQKYFPGDPANEIITKEGSAKENTGGRVSPDTAGIKSSVDTDQKQINKINKNGADDNATIKNSEANHLTTTEGNNNIVLKKETVRTEKQHQKNGSKADADLLNSSKPFFNNPKGEKQSIIEKANTNTTTLFIQEPSPTLKLEALPVLIKAPLIDIKHLSASRTNVVPSKNTSASKTKTSSQHGFALTAFFSPNISIDHLEDDDHLAGPGRDRNEVRQHEQSSSSYSGGLLINYSLSKKIALDAGVTLTSSSTVITPKTIYAKPDNNGHTSFELHCASGYSYITPKGITPAVGDSVKILGSHSKLTYISMPVGVSFTIQKGRFSFHPGIGVGANFLTGGKTETNLHATETAVANISGLRHVYMDGRIGVGADYNLNKKISISVKPNARLAFTPINQQTPVKSYQNYMSIETGIKIKL